MIKVYSGDKVIVMDALEEGRTYGRIIALSCHIPYAGKILTVYGTSTNHKSFIPREADSIFSVEMCVGKVITGTNRIARDD